MTRTTTEDRWLSLGPGTTPLPERLLLRHARGEVLFITGAGISRPSGLPDFRGLVQQVYQQLDAATHAIVRSVPTGVCNQWEANHSLPSRQGAEIRRFVRGDYDVVLGMLEQRMDGLGARSATVRDTVANELSRSGSSPAPIHHALIRLAQLGAARAIITTNFDLLLEGAARAQRVSIASHSMGGIPRPSRGAEFEGVLHIHGSLSRDHRRPYDFVVTDRDFGEFYLRRRVIPDFIYDAARLFSLVLVGYSANDAPMRYLLNAVAADGSRFDDLKERFAFVSQSAEHDAVELDDWRGRGITPIPYSSANDHIALTNTLVRWAQLSPFSGSTRHIDAELKRIVSRRRSGASDTERDLFDHFVRRGTRSERIRIADLISRKGADLDWLDALITVSAEPRRAAP